jgi:hypothetical protein
VEVEVEVRYRFHAGEQDGGCHVPKRIAIVFHDSTPQGILLFPAERSKCFEPVIAIASDDSLLQIEEVPATAGREQLSKMERARSAPLTAASWRHRCRRAA